MPIFSTPTKARSLKYDFRLSARIYSFLSMISEEDNLQTEWSILPLLEEKRAFCLGFLIEENWVVLSLIINKEHSYWLINKTIELINDFKLFFNDLVKKEDLNQQLKNKLRTLHNKYKKEALNYSL